MISVDFKKPCRIHFIGIGGISMSGLAEVLLQRGFQVSGSDANKSVLTEKLEKEGAKIFYGQKASNIDASIDLVVYTAAIHEDNPEFAACKDAGLPMMTRAELLGQLMKNYELPIAVSGTHGKTTTTSMLSEVLLAMDADPTLSVGGMLKSIGGNIRIGASDLFVAEACEYTNSFLSLFPKISIILNIDADHLDFFKDLSDIRASFARFAKLLPPEGLLLLQSDIADPDEVIKDLSCPVLTFGILQDPEGGKKPGVWATDLSYDEKGRASFLFHMDGKTLKDLSQRDGYRLCDEVSKALSEDGKEEIAFPVSLGVVGTHNVSNSLSVIAIALLLGGKPQIIADALSRFTGTDRRFEYKGTIGDVTVIDDYAHHPTEIAATLAAAAKYPHKKLYLVFQPHTYSRTKSLFEEFADALSAADEVILADIYAARETDTLGVSSKDLASAIEKRGTKSLFFPVFDEIESYLLKNCSPGDLLITMGAGDVYKIGEHLLGK